MLSSSARLEPNAVTVSNLITLLAYCIALHRTFDANQRLSREAPSSRRTPHCATERLSDAFIEGIIEDFIEDVIDPLVTKSHYVSILVDVVVREVTVTTVEALPHETVDCYHFIDRNG